MSVKSCDLLLKGGMYKTLYEQLMTPQYVLYEQLMTPQYFLQGAIRYIEMCAAAHKHGLPG